MRFVDGIANINNFMKAFNLNNKNLKKNESDKIKIFFYCIILSNFKDCLLTKITKAKGPMYITAAKPNIMTHVNIPRIIQFLHLIEKCFFKI